MFKNTLRLFVRIENCFQKRHESHIAFIGLGNMGARMAKNLIKKGRNLKVYDVVPSAVTAVEGATSCGSPEEASRDASLVITMLPNGGIVKEAVAGEKGILKGIPKNSLLVDCSTIEPSAAQDISRLTEQNGVRFLDAPVSGGIMGAEAATLTFMVGGDENNVAEVKPVLEQMGAKIHHCGRVGNGQIAKICNNMVLGITMIGTAEALNIGVKLGLDPKLLTSIMNVSSARSWSSDTYNPVPGVMENVPASNEYKGGFSVPLIAKDLGLAENAGLSCEAPLLLGALAHQIFRTMMVNGYGDKDFSSVYQFLSGNK